MQINYAIIHTLDNTRELGIFSSKVLNLDNDTIYEYITNQIGNSMKDSGLFSTELDTTNNDISFVLEYTSELDNFTAMSNKLAKMIFDIYSKCDDYYSFDLLFCDYYYNDLIYIAVLKLNHKKEYVRNILTEGELININIENHLSVLPNFNNKIEEMVFINLQSKRVRIKEKKHMIEGKKDFIYSNHVLKCVKKLTDSQLLKTTTNIVKNVASEYGLDTTASITKAKSYLGNQIDKKQDINPIELGKHVFGENTRYTQSYNDLVQTNNLDSAIIHNKDIPKIKVQKHKIKTDTGIEITFPSKYIEDGKYINILSNDDGTISIELKNIGKITNTI